MKTKKGYPIFGGYPKGVGDIRSPEEIDKQIEYVMKHPDDESAFYYTSHKEGCQIDEEIGCLTQEKIRTQRVLKKLDEIEINPEVIALRKQLIALFRRYESVICQADIDGCREIVFAKDYGAYSFPADMKREREGIYNQLTYEKHFDWEHIDLPSEELFQSLEVMPSAVKEVLEEYSQTDS